MEEDKQNKYGQDDDIAHPTLARWDLCCPCLFSSKHGHRTQVN